MGYTFEDVFTPMVKVGWSKKGDDINKPHYVEDPNDQEAFIYLNDDREVSH